ncbi:MAG: hypothetical protein U1E53_17680 [Dongiaceae bacterium]
MRSDSTEQHAVAPRKGNAGQRIGGDDADADGEQRGEAGGLDAVDQAVGELLARQHREIVVEGRREAEQRDAAEDVGPGLERGQQDPEQREQPGGDHGDRDHRVQQALRAAGAAPPPQAQDRGHDAAVRRSAALRATTRVDDDQHQRHGAGGSHLVAAEALLPDHDRQRVGRDARAAVGHHVDQVEALEVVDGEQQRHHGDHRPEQRQHDAPADRPGAGAVDHRHPR